MNRNMKKQPDIRSEILGSKRVVGVDIGRSINIITDHIRINYSGSYNPNGLYIN